MFDLDAALRDWRRTARACSLSAGELDELEDHLRSSYVAHRERGKTPREAFAISLRTLGAMEQVASEYRKVRGLTWRRLLKVGWAMFAVAFLLPVVDGGISLTEWNLSEGLLPGFQAIRVAMEEGGWYGLSALTNLLMLATMWRGKDTGGARALLLGVAMSGSAVLNGVLWLPEFGLDLRPGYYLWWTSFALAAAALVIRARALGWWSLPSTASD